MQSVQIDPPWGGNLSNALAAFDQIGMLMERGGRGGALFRNFYRDFLTEADSYLDHPSVRTARAIFCGNSAALDKGGGIIYCSRNE
ncbi:MAG: DUF4872 domain-containing protein [Anaerolineaceae bacterium]|nr:DUF4872 domain-containing protein [Anaerolineaceae bacterium]